MLYENIVIVQEKKALLDIAKQLKKKLIDSEVGQLSGGEKLNIAWQLIKSILEGIK